ncbi:adenosine deaminase 2-like isoform X2 [Wyeomyia smithii]|uniref:adenosine deaminase 2-like isoform X2 n=1 Tax=Wyeomyia smithii TaxID=174621 RepID=UPI0024681F31|nr:adenosine deaminase 2-like isoform X2 [Wyeomyia smithii]
MKLIMIVTSLLLVLLKLRKSLIEEETNKFLGADLVLNEDETAVNEYLMTLKKAELEQGFNNSYTFIPARHFFEMLDRFKESRLFHLIQRLPKGGVLHAHDTAIGSTDLVIKATYQPNLWQKGEFDTKEDPQFLFSNEKPGEDDWEPVENIRQNLTPSVYDEKIRKLFGLYTENPINTYKTLDDVWNKFQHIFGVLTPIITYEPVWRQYYYASLQQLYDDNVHYLELRGVLPDVYDLSGKIYSPDEIVQIYIDETEKFKKSHPLFLGAKFIYAPSRFADDTEFQTFTETAKRLHENFPDFVAGFDLVGQEDTGRPLISFVPELLKLPDSMKFFFHAGETNWNGLSTDENLIDAILLGTKRIGHGFAILKHPKLLNEVKEQNICLEINPVSNQVLKLVDDYRNHPAAVFFSDNYPVVVSSDDPSFWRAAPLSHDFYMAFVGISSAHHDLRLLKQLAINSLDYSAMDESERNEAKSRWEESWHSAMKEIIRDVVKSS